ncbi:hypothetical protein SAMN04487926_12756 [Paraburkholderia steynii]|uniref:Uncharacterized protein n=1 Tax=Paraburkholderia steynii TaxID=1245441 RepID=A0A7Z7BDR9_9BURK|nr:hypothetical protein [Paraburkholderia steynii]SDI92391.1 hypothetical protein SAMN04487926_12756 [Paraburkholderia steynii]
MMEDATRRYMPIVVEFDPDFMLVSMEMWRKSPDMQIPIADELKIHFMENRRRLLEGFVTTGKAWKIIVHDLKAVDESAGLDDVRLAVQAFLSWAEDGLQALGDLSPKCC